jgi:D-alanyl-lipoteichoic acid acyltransferase DltB (MBOAT superfamily)
VLFNSFEFAVFLPLVLILYWTLPRRFQNPLLLVASYVFYGAWDWRFLGLLWLSTATDYLVGRGLGTTEEIRRRRRLLTISLVVNLGILAGFKYFNFFVDSAATLLEGFGLSADGPTLRIILPVGISFYTFQTLAYTIDVYRRKTEVEYNPITFALYVAFFPQLVAGPIERAQRLIPQLREPRDRIGWDRVRSGLFLIALGLFKKVAVADALAPYVDQAFGSAATTAWINLLVGVYAFALQIYGDFSGYTDIARGTSRLLGVELMINFQQPYLSRNITNFWRTWHISLSTWLRDYLYIPLGGNRKGTIFTYRNLMITMLLGGLWHGAAWTFVMWGGLHGLYLAVHRWWRHRSPVAATDPFTLRDVIPTMVTFHLVCLGWVFFRAETFAQAFEVLEGISSLRAGAVNWNAAGLTVFLGAITLLINLVQRNGADHGIMLTWPAPARGVVYAVLALGLLIFAGGDTIPFIYFQF